MSPFQMELEEFLLTFLWVWVICVTQWTGLFYINNLLDFRFSWKNQAISRLIIGTVLTLAYSFIAFVIAHTAMHYIINGKPPGMTIRETLNASVFTIFIAFGVTIFSTAVGFFNAWRKSIIEAERFKTEMLAYKYESLQNQLNPHFLFNSFNVLSDLVYEDQKKAVVFIKQLSLLFRYVLDSKDKELIMLREELEFIDSYKFLLKTRFEEKLEIDIKIETNGSDMVVPMTMQLLIENCVKHNEISNEKPLRIKCFRSDDYIEVHNNFQPKFVGPDSKKMGLSNIKQQYQMFTTREIEISQTEEVFSVRVPIIKSLS